MALVGGMPAQNLARGFGDEKAKPGAEDFQGRAFGPRGSPQSWRVRLRIARAFHGLAVDGELGQTLAGERVVGPSLQPPGDRHEVLLFPAR